MSELVHVNKIEIANCSELAGMMFLRNDKCAFRSMPIFEKIEAKGLIGVKIDENTENGQKVFTTTATFLTEDRDGRSWYRKCFRLTTIKGKQFLIGSYDRPYPNVKEESNFPQNPADSSLKKITITWKSMHPMMSISE